MEAIDDRVRAAMKALDDRAPARTHLDDDDLVARVTSRLEERMESNADTTRDADSGTPPPRGPTDDSGLHDIKALAKTTRQRVSRRITSQHDIDESLLSASSSGLRAVALPEPAKLISLPDVEEVLKTSHDPAVIRAAASVAAHPSDPTRHGRMRVGRAMWIGGSVLAAAAVVMFVVMGGGATKGGGGRPASEGVSAGGAGSAGGSSAVREEAKAQSQSRADLGAVGAATQPPGGAQVASTGMGSGSGSSGGDTMMVATGSGSAAGSATEGDNTAEAAKDDFHTTVKHHAGSGGGSGSGSGSGSSKEKIVPKTDGKTPDKGKPPAGGGPKSLDQLIDDAAGGPTGGGGAQHVDKPVLEKKELTSSDIRTGMSSVAGRAKACYDKFGVAGTVGVRAVVAPSGAVTKATATGSFAGTPTGDCVASAVSGASFPAWDGPPMTINYSYLLSE